MKDEIMETDIGFAILVCGLRVGYWRKKFREHDKESTLDFLTRLLGEMDSQIRLILKEREKVEKCLEEVRKWDEKSED